MRIFVRSELKWLSGNTLGKAFAVTCFGESHGRCVGVVIDGCPSGLRIEESDIQNEVARRIPKDGDVASARVEEDRVEILSGIYKGYTTGAPLAALVWNKDVRSEDYAELTDRPRPGHADYPARMKYGGFGDLRGGGRWSGRMTLAFVIAGAVARKILAKSGIEILAHASQIGRVSAGKVGPDDIRKNTYTNPIRTADLTKVEAMVSEILQAKREGDSVGGVVEFTVLNLPVGLGEPIFDALDADLAKALFTIPAVKGVEFGSGFAAAATRGSENNDQFMLQEGKVVTTTNRSGGVLGGMTSGLPVTGRVAFKPPSSIAKPQRTVDLKSLKEVEIAVKGRHDPCIVPKAVPAVEAALCIVLADHMIRSGTTPKVLRG